MQFSQAYLLMLTIKAKTHMAQFLAHFNFTGEDQHRPIIHLECSLGPFGAVCFLSERSQTENFTEPLHFSFISSIPVTFCVESITNSGRGTAPNFAQFCVWTLKITSGHVTE